MAYCVQNERGRRTYGVTTHTGGGGWTQYRWDARGSGNTKVIRLDKLNISSGRAGGLEAELRLLRQGNVDRVVLQNKKLMDRINTSLVEGYSIYATVVENRHRGEVPVVWRDDAGLQVEGIVNIGPDVASFLLALWLWIWYVFLSYVPQNDAPAVH